MDVDGVTGESLHNVNYFSSSFCDGRHEEGVEYIHTSAPAPLRWAFLESKPSLDPGSGSLGHRQGFGLVSVLADGLGIPLAEHF